MAQITLYIDNATQARLRAAARSRRVSQSQYVADLVRRATETTWPEEVLALAGSVPDFPQAEMLRALVAEDAARASW